VRPYGIYDAETSRFLEPILFNLLIRLESVEEALMVASPVKASLGLTRYSRSLAQAGYSHKSKGTGRGMLYDIEEGRNCLVGFSTAGTQRRLDTLNFI